MVHMSNNRHVTNVMLEVHNPSKLFSCELHHLGCLLMSIKITLCSCHLKHRQMLNINQNTLNKVKFIQKIFWCKTRYKQGVILKQNILCNLKQSTFHIIRLITKQRYKLVEKNPCRTNIQVNVCMFQIYENKQAAII